MKYLKIILPFLAVILIQHWYFQSQINSLRTENNVPVKETSNTEHSVSRTSPNFAQLVERARPSVVSIEVSSRERRRGVDGMGSGFIISEDGFLLTNYHVTDGANRIEVKLADGTIFDAEIVGSDIETDLALLKIDASNLKPLEYGEVESTLVGSWVLAIGAPFGLEQTVTAGIVSAKGRSAGDQYIPYLQTDVAINMGNSGGPLINMQGKVIGVNSKIYSTDGGSVGLSFAIPIDLAVDVVNQLKQNGKVSRGFLGVGYQEVTRDMAEGFELKNSNGTLINAVTPNSPAAKAGLRVGDIVVSVDGNQIANFNELPFLIGRLRPGAETALSIIRDGEQMLLKLVVGSREQQAQNFRMQIPTFPQQESSVDNILKVGVIAIPETIKETYGIDHGVLINRIEAGPALDAGLDVGDVITSIRFATIESTEDFLKALTGLPKSGTLPVLVTRPGQGTRFVAISISD